MALDNNMTDIDNAIVEKERLASELATLMRTHEDLVQGQRSTVSKLGCLEVIVPELEDELSLTREAFETSQVRLADAEHCLQDALVHVRAYEEEAVGAAVLLKEDAGKRSSRFEAIEQRLRLEVCTLRSQAMRRKIQYFPRRCVEIL